MDPWDPYSIFKELKGKARKDQSQGTETRIECPVSSSFDDLTSLLGVIPLYLNERKFIVYVIMKKRPDERLEEIIISYQIYIQSENVITWQKYCEKTLPCFNFRYYVSLKVDLATRQIIFFSREQPWYEGVIYVYNLETFSGQELRIPYLDDVGGSYKNHFIFSCLVSNLYTLEIKVIDLTTKREKHKIHLIPSSDVWRIQVLEYHFNFIVLFFTMDFCIRSRKAEIWDLSCGESKSPILVFETCNEIWEFFSFPPESNFKKEDIILGVYSYKEKTINAQIEIWKIDCKNQVERIQKHSFPQSESGGKFLQISINYFVYFTTYSVRIYEIKNFGQIQKLDFYPNKIINVFYSPITDNRLWITFRNGEIKIF